MDVGRKHRYSKPILFAPQQRPFNSIYVLYKYSTIILSSSTSKCSVPELLRHNFARVMPSDGLESLGRSINGAWASVVRESGARVSRPLAASAASRRM